MSDETFQSLLDNIPRGESIKDPREGDYPDAVVQGAELVKNSTGSYAVVVTYGSIRNSEGVAFEHKQRYNLPESHSDIVVKRIFRDVLKDHGLIPRGQKEPLLFDDDGARGRVESAFQALRGTNVPIRLVPRKESDFLDARVIRTRR